MIIVNQIKLFRPIFIFINFINKQVLASHLYKSICQVEQTMARLRYDYLHYNSANNKTNCTFTVQFQLKLTSFPPTTLRKNFFNLSLHPKQPYMKYKLIVLDLDGTLTNSKKKSLPATGKL